MSALTKIRFDECSFTFQGDLKFNESAKYKLEEIEVRHSSFMSNAFKNLIRMLLNIAKSTQFIVKINSSTLIADSEWELICEKLSINFQRLKGKKITFSTFSCESSWLEKVIDLLV